jgi:hypothetical protein
MDWDNGSYQISIFSLDYVMENSLEVKSMLNKSHLFTFIRD